MNLAHGDISLDSDFDFNAPKKARPPLYLTRFGGAAVVFFVGFLVHAWTAVLEFQLDDFEQVYEAMLTDGPAVLLGKDEPSQQAIRGHPTMVKFFRPVLHASLVVDTLFFGASPRALHLSSVLWHSLTAAVLFLVLRSLWRWRSPRLALASALIFAVHPGKMGAVVWIAARGDILMTFGFLVALWATAHVRRGSTAKSARFAVFAGLLFCLGSKEGAIICPVLLAAIDLFFLRRLGEGTPLKKALRLCAGYFLLAPVAYLSRTYFFGADAEFYAGERRIWTMSIVFRMFADFLPALSSAATGHYAGDAGSIVGKVSGVTTSALGGALLVWIARRPILRTRGVLAILFFYAVAVLPTLRLYREGSGFDASRLFYLPSIFVSILIALPLEGFRSRLRIVRTATTVVFGLLAVTTALSAARQIGAQLEAAEIIRRVRDDVRAIATADGGKTTAYIVLDVPDSIRKAPCYGTFMSYAFLPPIAPTFIPVRWVHSRDILFGTELLHSIPAPARILAWDADERRILPITPVLPAPIKRTWTVTIVGSSVDLAKDPIIPRAVETLSLTFENPAETFEFTLRFRDDTQRTVDFVLKNDVATPNAAAFFIPVGRHADWVTKTALVGAEIVAADGAAIASLGKVTVSTAERLPGIKAVSPGSADAVSLSAAEPTFFFEPGSPALPFYRLTILTDTSALTWTMKVDDLDKNGDRLGIRPSMQGLAPGEVPHLLSELKGLLDRRGVAEMPLVWKIEGLRETGGPPQSQSDGIATRIVR